MFWCHPVSYAIRIPMPFHVLMPVRVLTLFCILMLFHVVMPFQDAVPCHYAIAHIPVSPNSSTHLNLLSDERELPRRNWKMMQTGHSKCSLVPNVEYHAHQQPAKFCLLYGSQVELGFLIPPLSLMSFPWLFPLGIAILSSRGWWPTLPISCYFLRFLPWEVFDVLLRV